MVINVNVPYLKESELKGFMITRQGLRVYRDALDVRADPRGKAYFWIGEEYFSTNSADGTDYNAVELGYVSVTPMKSDMTDHQALTAIETWKYLKDSELLHKS